MPSLIIGANGFLARHVARLLRREGELVDGVTHRSAHPDLGSDYRDIVPIGTLNELSRMHYEAVYLIGAYIPYGRMDDLHSGLIDSNIGLPIQVVKTFPTARLVHASSVSVYENGDGYISHRSPAMPASRYGWSKLSGEGVVRQHTDSVSLRFSSIYGQGMAQTSFVPRVIQQAKAHSRIQLFGDGSRRQDYLHVSDAAILCKLAAEADETGSLLAAYGHSFSNVEIAEIVKSCVPGSTIEFSGEDAANSGSYDMSHTNAILSFTPKVTPAQGIRELAETS